MTGLLARYANKPVCQTMSKEFCDTHQVKSACRYVKKPVSRVRCPIGVPVALPRTSW